MKNKNSTFYCFSPPVMIATFAIEISLLLYILIRYKMSSLTRLIATALLLLATFQFAEFHVCESIGVTDFYSRLGYVAITLLPPVSIHLVSKISGRNSKKLVRFAYMSGVAFALAFAFNPSVFDSFACTSNYAVFHLDPRIGYIYTVYYHGWLLAGITMCFLYAKTAKKKVRRALYLQAFGFISFMIPTGIVNLLNPSTMEGIPSIMCGFAVIYAFILVFGIAPLTLKRQLKSKRLRS